MLQFKRRFMIHDIGILANTFRVENPVHLQEEAKEVDFPSLKIENRNLIFFTLLAFLFLLTIFAYQRSITQQAIFVRDRQLYAATIQAYNQGDYQSALDYLQASSEPFQQDWNYYYILGSIHMEMGNYIEADECLQQTEDIAPMVLTMSEFLTKRGQLYILLENKTEALAYLNRSSKVSPKDERQQIQLLIKQAESLP